MESNHLAAAMIVLMTLLAFSPAYELGYCENGRCTTVTDDKGICPPTSIQVGRRCVFPSQESAMTEQPFGNGRFASATEALDEAETMTSAEHAQLAIAAQMAGMDLDDFIAALAVENGAG